MVFCWERADILVILFVMFPCAFVTSPYGVSGQVLCLIVWIYDMCLLLYFLFLTCHQVGIPIAQGKRDNVNVRIKLRLHYKKLAQRSISV